MNKISSYTISCSREKPGSCVPLGLIRIDDLNSTPLPPTRDSSIEDINNYIKIIIIMFIFKKKWYIRPLN